MHKTLPSLPSNGLTLLTGKDTKDSSRTFGKQSSFSKQVVTPTLRRSYSSKLTNQHDIFPQSHNKKLTSIPILPLRWQKMNWAKTGLVQSSACWGLEALSSCYSSLRIIFIPCQFHTKHKLLPLALTSASCGTRLHLHNQLHPNYQASPQRPWQALTVVHLHLHPAAPAQVHMKRPCSVQGSSSLMKLYSLTPASPRYQWPSRCPSAPPSTLSVTPQTMRVCSPCPKQPTAYSFISYCQSSSSLGWEHFCRIGTISPVPEAE